MAALLLGLGKPAHPAKVIKWEACYATGRLKTSKELLSDSVTSAGNSADIVWKQLQRRLKG